MICHIVTESPHHLLIKSDHPRMALKLSDMSIIKIGATCIGETAISHLLLREIEKRLKELILLVLYRIVSIIM